MPPGACETTDEIAADAVRILERRTREHPLRGPGADLRYALTIGQNTIRRAWRQAKAECCRPLEFEPAVADRSFDAVDCADFLERVSSDLDPEERSLVQALLARGGCLIEVSEDLHCSAAAVRQRVHRLRERLATALEAILPAVQAGARKAIPGTGSPARAAP
jgi:DNA-directed RNA polymerase specialized sigma24 family protein